MKILKEIILASVVCFGSSVFACDFCTLGQGVSPYLVGNSSGVTLDSTYIHADQIYDHNNGVSTNGKAESWTLFSVTGFYSLSPEWSVAVTIPYVSKANVDFDSSTNTNPGVIVAGLGDLSFTGRYTLYNNHTNQGTSIGGVLLGLKFPTGSTGEKDQTGEAADRHAQPGTGSYDVNLGFTSAYTGDGYQATFDAVYSYAGKGTWGGRNHRFGDTVNAAVKVYVKTSTEDINKHAFYIFTGPSLERTGKEVGTQTDTGYDSNMVNPSSGGTVVYWNLGFYGVMSEATMINAGVAKAVYRDMNFDSSFDADPAESYKLNMSVSFLF
ncbi:MAG: hypothetical protein ACM3MG_09235 [Bacillota bacterium]